MTILAKSSPIAPSLTAGGDNLMTLQCDVCFPPFIATNTIRNLIDAYWLCTANGDSLDVCPVCRRRKPRDQLTPRRLSVKRQAFAPGALPNLVIIGAAKCATTSLHAYLSVHPDISMSIVKEPQYFSDPDCAEWRPYYESQFRQNARIRGESSTVYTRYPAVPGVAERMAETVPSTQLIYLVRDPVERALASFVEEKMHDNERRNVEQAFADLDDPFNPYVAASRYAQQLTRYVDAFDDARWLVIEMEELGDSPDSVMGRVFKFLDVEPVTATEEYRKLNARGTKREYPGLVRRLRASPLLRGMYRLPSGPREAILAPVRRTLSRRIERPQPPDDLRRALEDQLRPDAALFRELTGEPFARWSI